MSFPISSKMYNKKSESLLGNAEEQLCMVVLRNSSLKFSFAI